MNIVDIIIPVYDGYAETVRCLSSVLNATNSTAREIIVIYDAGPNPKLLEYLEQLAARKDITLLVNSNNLGFVATVNRGMALHIDRDVVLLNSDTEVNGDWLDRMVACAHTNHRVGTVTPFSNNAEICSFPNLCQSAELPPDWSAGRIDNVFAKHVVPTAIDIPTAVGFCMFIARRAIAQVGYFNEELFGRGYGEENDFCRRLAAKRWRNVLCTNVFVYHAGGVSFGAEKAQRVASAMAVLDRLYPDYHRLVHEFIRLDTPSVYRLQAQLAMLDRDRPRILFITHNLDGGTSKHTNELAGYLAHKAYFFTLRMCSDEDLTLSATTEWGELDLRFKWPEQAALFNQAVQALGIVKIHIHHIKGAERFAREFLLNNDTPYDVTLHDYYLINGNPALADKTGRFCDDISTRDALCAEHSPVPLALNAKDWRDFTGILLARAARVFAPSRYTADLFAEYFPNLTITVLPHPDWEIDQPYPSVRQRAFVEGEPFVVAVLGALGLEKGADILEKVAVLAAKNGCPLQFHLLGYAYRELKKEVSVHGAYEDSSLDRNLVELNPHLIWFPCQWPETYSYTLSACLRGGYPVLAPALGAFAERLRDRPRSWLQPFPVTPESWLSALMKVRDEAAAAKEAQVYAWDSVSQANADTKSYVKNYIDVAANTPHIAALAWQDLLLRLENPSNFDGANSRREKVLRALLKLRQAPVMRAVIRIIPFSLQRRIKRRLSTRSLHQIAPDLL